MQQAIFFGLLINSALYIAGCFVAGIVFGVPLAWKLAMATAAICYMSYFAQGFVGYDGGGYVSRPVVHGVSLVLVVASIVTGSAAGLSLLFR